MSERHTEGSMLSMNGSDAKRCVRGYRTFETIPRDTEF
jgi:hypothetical protein